MRIIRYLAFAFLALVLYAPAANAAETDGRFCGRMWSGGKIVDVVTTLEIDADRRIVGTYEFPEQGVLEKGTIQEMLRSRGLTRRFLWKDRFGSDRAIFTFTRGFKSFKGHWYDSRGRARVWTGTRC